MKLIVSQVLLRLMGVQTYIAELSKAYIEHINNVINGESATIDLPPVPDHLIGQVEHGLHPQSPGADAGGQKKRKRGRVDPNAPKRALTPYFLYMQHNRPRISADLGENARPKEVADEGTRRWQTMPDEEKEVCFAMALVIRLVSYLLHCRFTSKCMPKTMRHTRRSWLRTRLASPATMTLLPTSFSKTLQAPKKLRSLKIALPSLSLRMSPHLPLLNLRPRVLPRAPASAARASLRRKLLSLLLRSRHLPLRSEARLPQLPNPHRVKLLPRMVSAAEARSARVKCKAIVLVGLDCLSFDCLIPQSSSSFFFFFFIKTCEGFQQGRYDNRFVYSFWIHHIFSVCQSKVYSNVTLI